MSDTHHHSENPQETTTPDSQATSSTLELPITAKASRSYRRTRYFVATIFFAVSLLFAYDGWVAWPAKNAEIEKLTAEKESALAADDKQRIDELEVLLEDLGEPKSDADLFIQKVFFIGLGPGAIILIVNALYRSRGAVVYDGSTVQLPDGRSVDVDSITEVDNRRWDKKGIAIFYYSDQQTSNRNFRLDDFIYDRPPIDRIHEELCKKLRPEAAPEQMDVTADDSSASS
ncbi:MAG: hypothetical protein ACFCU4_09765 [Puniceicoccaceae bacterium]